MKKIFGCGALVVVAAVAASMVSVMMKIGEDGNGDGIDTNAPVDTPERSQDQTEGKDGPSEKDREEVDRIAADRSLWPQKVTLNKAVEMPIVSGGKEVGSMTVKAGQLVDVLAIADGMVQVGQGEGRATVPASQTDLVAQSELTVKANEAKEAAKQSEADSAVARSFMQSSLDAGWVTHIEQNDDPNLAYHFYVRLPAEKYTTKENVKKIAEFIARSYVMQSKNKGGSARSATVHVFQGNKVLVRGSYRD